MKQVGKLIIATLGCELVGLLSTPFTLAAIPTWYETLNKPAFIPPNQIFAPVWTILYLLIGIALYLVWRQGLRNRKVKIAVGLFLFQLLLNFMWSVLFFGLRSPLLGLVDISILLLSIIVTMQKFYPLSRRAFYLMVPYVLWVGFASILNLAILVMN